MRARGFSRNEDVNPVCSLKNYVAYRAMQHVQCCCFTYTVTLERLNGETVREIIPDGEIQRIVIDTSIIKDVKGKNIKKLLLISQILYF